MKYKVVFDDDGSALFEGEDQQKVFAKAREFDADARYTDNVYVEDEDGKVFEDLTAF